MVTERWRSIPELIGAQAELNPMHTAIVGADATFSYRELQQATSRLAGTLYASRASAEDPVAILVERGAIQLAAALGVLCSGAPYACIDTAQPAARIDRMLDACGARFVVTDRDVRSENGILAIDADVLQPSGNGHRSASRPIARTDLAYVMFTSGSTGAPKVVQVTHGGLANYAAWMADVVGQSRSGASQLRFATVTSLATDLGNTAIFPALIRGDVVHVVPSDVAADAEDFGVYITDARIDILKTTPSHFGVLFDEAGPCVAPDKVLLLGGEPLHWRLANRVRELCGCRLINHYGPTEATIGSLFYEVDNPSEDHRAGVTVPIGCPITGTRAYVVDECMRQLAPNIEGELMLAGAGIAAGYRKAPDLTYKRFPNDPFSAQKERAYLTGDIVRMLDDGVVEFIGRRDRQIKLRGHRIEIGEIEQALQAHPRVRVAAVVPIHKQPETVRLVAYVVAVDEDLTPADLRVHMRAMVPNHLVPAEFALIQALPLTLSGKTDVQALIGRHGAQS